MTDMTATIKVSGSSWLSIGFWMSLFVVVRLCTSSSKSLRSKQSTVAWVMAVWLAVFLSMLSWSQRLLALLTF